ncbi:hypothetical protein AAVH_06476 [Aphelenchoides avenae]|nr:hypothetical protein AAVH_06476 [Aphelenchus avenae]
MKLNDTPVVIEVEPLLQKCRVCYEEISRDEFVECAASTTHERHSFCKRCVATHATTTLSEHSQLAPHGSGLRCMDKDCTEAIPTDSLRDILDPATLFSLLSRIAWDKHGPYDDESSSGPSAAMADADKTLEEQLSAVFIRRCPACNRALVKTIGCAHVTCPCGTALCFVCNRRYEPKTCAVKCLKVSHSRDREKLKELYDQASPSQRKRLRLLYADIEKYGSLKYKVRDALYEHWKPVVYVILILTGIFFFVLFLIVDFNELMADQ